MKKLINQLKSNQEVFDYRLTFDRDVVEGLDERAKQIMTKDGYAGFCKHLKCEGEVYIEFRSPTATRE